MYPNQNDITYTTLSNGLVLIVRENHTAPVAVLHGSLAVGAMHETPEQAGLAAFVATMLSRGSRRYDFDAFNAAVENVGGNLTFSAETHSTNFGIVCLREDFPALVDVLADCLRYPAFPVEQVDRVRQQRLVDLQERDEDTASMANLRFYETLFGRQHAYGRSTSGYIDTVKPLQRADLQTFHAAWYTPSQGALVVTGDVDASAVIDLIAASFGDWSGRAGDRVVLAPPAVITPAPSRMHVALADKVQADIVLGVPGIARSHPDFYALRVANCILGQFGMMGRLGASLREEQGLAYYAYSSLAADTAGGVWSAAAGVHPDHVDAAIAAMQEELASVAAEGVSEEELEDSQAYLTGQLPLALETNEGVAATLLSMEWYGLGLDYLLRYKDLIYAVTPADIQRVCATYLQPQRAVTVVAGPV